MQVRRILVPTDFSNSAKAALNSALQLGIQFQAELHLLHVVQPQLQYMEMGEMPLPLVEVLGSDLKQAAEKKIQELAKTCGSAIPVHTHVDESSENTANAIIRQSDELDCDLIAIGRHGHGMLERFLLGSTVERVVRLSDKPVWVAPAENE